VTQEKKRRQAAFVGELRKKAKIEIPSEVPSVPGATSGPTKEST
jgi:hypothetical protein